MNKKEVMLLGTRMDGTDFQRWYMSKYNDVIIILNDDNRGLYAEYLEDKKREREQLIWIICGICTITYIIICITYIFPIINL